MIKNDFGEDLKKLSVWSGKKKREVAAEVGTPAPYITKMGRLNIVNKAFVRVVEAFGYDIEVRYIKRDERECASEKVAGDEREGVSVIHSLAEEVGATSAVQQ